MCDIVHECTCGQWIYRRSFKLIIIQIVEKSGFEFGPCGDGNYISQTTRAMVKPQSQQIVRFCNDRIVGDFIRQRLVARVLYDLRMQSYAAIVFWVVVRHAVRLYWIEKRVVDNRTTYGCDLWWIAPHENLRLIAWPNVDRHNQSCN